MLSCTLRQHVNQLADMNVATVDILSKNMVLMLLFSNWTAASFSNFDGSNVETCYAFSSVVVVLVLH